MSDVLEDVVAHFTGQRHETQWGPSEGAGRQVLLRASEQSAITRADPLRPLSTKWRLILSLELRGLAKSEIARRLHRSYASIINITNSPRYVEWRDRQLAAADDEFINLKPLAVAAIRRGLSSLDDNTALRASEQYFHRLGYGVHHANNNATAESVAAALLAGAVIQISNHITVEGADSAAGTSRHESVGNSGTD